MTVSRFEHGPSERQAGLEHSMVPHEQRNHNVRPRRLRDDTVHELGASAAEEALSAENPSPTTGTPPVAESTPPEITATPQRRRLRLPMTSLKFDTPYVDYDVAKEVHPGVFRMRYDRKEKSKDRPALRSMVKMFNSHAIANRVERVYASDELPEDFRPILSHDGLQDFAQKAKMYRLLKPEEVIVLTQHMKRGVAAFRTMERKKDFTDPLLIGLAREGVFAHQALFTTNVRLTLKPASGFAPSFPHVQKWDIVQLGMEGLQVAIEKFDEKKGFKFSTYADHWIKHSMQRGLQKTGRMITIPNDRAIQKRKIDVTINNFIGEHGREPNIDEIAAATNYDADTVVHLEVVGTTHMTSLNQKVSSDGGTELGDLQEARNNEQKAEEAEEAKNRLASMLANTTTLDTIDRLILSLRHGVFLEELIGAQIGPDEVEYVDAFYDLPGTDGNPPTYAVIGRLFKISDAILRSRVRSIFEKIEAANDPVQLYKNTA